MATSVEKRILAELSQETFSDEHAAVSGLELTTTMSCLKAYKKFNCRYNFPSCDPETGEVIPVCLTDCELAHSNCGNDPEECTKDRTPYRNLSEDDTADSCDSLI